MKYLPFGDCLESQGTLGTDKEFTGQRLDATELYYYNARYYDPQIGRFISADTEGIDYNNPQTLNRYTYCLNNPLKYTDPTGNWPNFANIAKNIASTVKAAVSTAVNVAKQATETIKQAEITAAKAVAKGVVTAAVEVTGVAVEHEQSTKNGRVVQVGSITANIDLGYIEIDGATGGLVANILDMIQPTPGSHAEGITIPTPLGSVVFINQTEAGSNLPIDQAHEKTHVVQQHVLGPAFLPLYYLGQWAYGGYDYNPFEKQAVNNSDPTSWNTSSNWWDWLP